MMQRLKGQSRASAAAADDLSGKQPAQPYNSAAQRQRLTCSDDDDDDNASNGWDPAEGHVGPGQRGRVRDVVLEDRAGLSGSDDEGWGSDVDLAGLLQVMHIDTSQLG